MQSPSRATLLKLAITSSVLALPLPAQGQTQALVVGGSPSETYAEPYYGLDAGIFARAGLDVQVAAFPNGASIAQAVIAGSIDVGLTDPIQVANATIRNVPILYVAPGVQYTSATPTTALCAARESTVRSAKDLEGQTIAVNGLKSTAECAAREWMRLNGADSTKARFVELPPPALVPAIVRGTVAAAMVSEPALSQGGDTIRILAKALDAVAKTFLLNSYAARSEWVLANRQTAQRFARAIAETARWSNSNHPATALTLAKYAKIESDQLQRMNRVTFGEKLEPRLVQPVIDLALRYGTISRGVSAADVIARI